MDLFAVTYQEDISSTRTCTAETVTRLMHVCALRVSNRDYFLQRLFRARFHALHTKDALSSIFTTA